MSNPPYNESDEIMVSFMMYTVSDSNKRGVKGARNSATGECDSATSECDSAMYENNSDDEGKILVK